MRFTQGMDELLGVAGMMTLLVMKWIIPENSLCLAPVSHWPDFKKKTIQKDMGMSENVGLIFPMKQPFKNGIGIMISKTIGFRSTLFSDKPISLGHDMMSGSRHGEYRPRKTWFYMLYFNRESVNRPWGNPDFLTNF